MTRAQFSRDCSPTGAMPYDARVTYEHAHRRAVVLGNGGEGRPHAGLVGHVGAHRQRARLGELRRSVRQVDDRAPVSIRDQPPRDAVADAARRARHDRHGSLAGDRPRLSLEAHSSRFLPHRH